MQRALSALDSKLSGSDKSISKLEQGLGALSASFQKANASASSMATPLQAAQKAMDDLTAAGLRYNSKGRVITAEGKFAATEQATAYNKAATSVQTLTAAQEL